MYFILFIIFFEESLSCVIAEDCEVYTELFVRKFFLRWKTGEREIFPCLLQQMWGLQLSKPIKKEAMSLDLLRSH